MSTPALWIELLPVAHGDALWIEWEGEAGRRKRMLIDGGPAKYYGALRERILRQAPDERHFELLVVTHIDTDHIDGAIRLLLDESLGVSFGDIWFNGWHHVDMPEVPLLPDQLGAEHGEFLGALLAARELPWNEAFGRKAVAVTEPEELPVKRLDDGPTLTVLSPGLDQLEELGQAWEETIPTGLEPGDTETFLARLTKRKAYRPPPPEDLLGTFASDDSEANGSSIALLLEYRGRRVVLAADAFAPVLADSLELIAKADGTDRVRLDAFKLSHHGSRANLSDDLLGRVRCPRFLISTNGVRPYKHPHEDAIQRVIELAAAPKELWFNYLVSTTRRWADADLQRRRGFQAKYRVTAASLCVPL